MWGTKKLKGTLHLLLLTVLITYTCLNTITFLNQFQPELLPSPLPAAPPGNSSNHVSSDSVWNSSDIVKTGNHTGLEKSQAQIVHDGSNHVEIGNSSMANDSAAHYQTVLQLEQTLTKISKKNNEEHVAEIGEESSEQKSKEQYKKKSKSKAEVWPIVLEPSNAASLHDIDLTKYSKEDQHILTTRLHEMEKRAKVVGRVCGKQPRQLHTPSGANHLIWDTKHDPNIVWCPNYKVASTSMMMNFMRLTPENSGIKSKKRVKQNDVHKLFLSPITGREKARVLKNSIRVIIVRHPFTRILSAYRDKMTKMEPGPPKFEFRKLQKKIITQYRSVNSSTDSPYPTFPEFVQYVIDETRDLQSTQNWREKVRCWVTYWAHCNVCTTDYNVIMKLETMAEDKNFLVTLANLEELKNESSNEWLHLKNATSHDLAPEFYSQLTRDQILQLYESYKLDFELFGYKTDEYLALV